MCLIETFGELLMIVGLRNISLQANRRAEVLHSSFLSMVFRRFCPCLSCYHPSSPHQVQSLANILHQIINSSILVNLIRPKQKKLAINYENSDSRLNFEELKVIDLFHQRSVLHYHHQLCSAFAKYQYVHCLMHTSYLRSSNSSLLRPELRGVGRTVSDARLKRASDTAPERLIRSRATRSWVVMM